MRIAFHHKLLKKALDNDYRLSAGLELFSEFGKADLSGNKQVELTTTSTEKMSTQGRQADTRRSPEVYRNLSEPDPEIPRANPKKGSSEGSLISDDFKLSWHRRVLFNMRSLNCFGKSLEQ